MQKSLIVLLSVCLLLLTVSGYAAEGKSISIQMNGAAGASVINGVTYQFFSLRPDISFWKFGVGLDLSFYFDAEGNLRDEDWDEGADVIDKIYYVRYGHSGDPLYVRVGSLAPITLGYGLVMRRYTNAIEWPQVRRIGMQMEVAAGGVKVETFFNNFRELDEPGLVGARVSYALPIMIPLVAGVTVVHDGNQYLGAKDEDDDGIPDRQDQFPGINDGQHINELRSIPGLTTGAINRLIELGDLPDINNPPSSIADKNAKVTEFGLDVGMPILNTERMNLWVYGQAAQIADYGRGYAVPGAVFNLGPFRASAEYRIFEEEFMSEFFNMAYETERIAWDEDSADYITKSERLAGLPSAQGFYADAGVMIANIIDIYAAYQDMAYGEGIPGKSFYGTATLNAKLIPKLSMAEAYFQQPNATDLFNTEADGTVMGYKIGFEMGQGLMLVYDNKTIYQNGEPNRIVTVETAIRF